MLTALALLLAQAAAGGSPPPPDCRHDQAATLSLDFEAFDQSMTSGWRPLARKGCTAEAADLIRDYRIAHPETKRASLLLWHEGQLRATAGETQAAIALFRQAYKPAEMDSGFGWNLYVDGTIAFLSRDRTALLTARQKLAALPKPADWDTDTARANARTGVPSWPLNLGVLDGFLRCFDKPYAETYICRK